MNSIPRPIASAVLVAAVNALFLSAVNAAGEDVAHRKSIQCFPATVPRTIDAQLTEWRDEVPLTMRQPDVKFWTAWDRENLYIACEAAPFQDARGKMPRLLLFLDLRPPKQRNDAYERGVYYVQFMVAPPNLDEDLLREGAKTGYWLAETDDPEKGRVTWKEFSWTGVVRTAVAAAMAADDGRTCLEARIPWNTFPLSGGKTLQPAPEVPSILALDWGIARPGGVLFWAGSPRNPHDPSKLASVELLADARNFSREKYERESPPGPVPAVEEPPKPEEGLPLSERSSPFKVTEMISPTRYAEGAPTKIEIVASKPAGYSVSPYIYGQFSEHLTMGWPMTRGLWSQLLLNPSFEPGHPRLGSAFNRHYLAGRAPQLLARWSPNFKDPQIVHLVLPPWTVVGDVRGVSIEGNAFNSQNCQKLAPQNDGEVGIGQVVRLPIHRERNYRVALYARCESPSVITASVRGIDAVVADSKLKVSGSTWRKYETTLSVPSDLNPDINRFFFALTLDSGGPVWLDYATVLPADNADGLCPEIIEIFRKLRPGHIRYPGGNFASGYHWRDGIGPRERRPTRLNPAWIGLEPNEVGTDELLRFCEKVGMKAMLCVNFGSGTPEEAADWVEYCNGAADTPMGKLRAQNGHPEPYNIRDWDIGNEVWGHWQIGHCPPDEYARGFLQFRKAMLARDPNIRISACGHSPFHEVGRYWNRTLYEICGRGVDIMTFHTYIAPLPPRVIPEPAPRLRTILSHPHYYEQAIRDMADRMRPHGIAQPKIAVTEYNLQGGQFSSRRLDRAAHMLWYAQMAHVWMRTGDLMPMCHVTEYSVFDVFRRRFGDLSPRYEVFKLYANRAGSQPVMTRVACPTYKVETTVRPHHPLAQVPIIDAVALTGTDEAGRFLSLLVVNKELNRDIQLRVELRDFTPAPEATLFTIHDPDPSGDPNKMPELVARKTSLRVDRSFPCEIPRCSVSLLRLTAAQ